MNACNQWDAEIYRSHYTYETRPTDVEAKGFGPEINVRETHTPRPAATFRIEIIRVDLFLTSTCV